MRRKQFSSEIQSSKEGVDHIVNPFDDLPRGRKLALDIDHHRGAMAPPKKRPLEEMMGSEDDDEPSMGRQILPVARLPADFNGEPADGMQYLFMVRSVFPLLV